MNTSKTGLVTTLLASALLGGILAGCSSAQQNQTGNANESPTGAPSASQGTSTASPSPTAKPKPTPPPPTPVFFKETSLTSNSEAVGVGLILVISFDRTIPRSQQANVASHLVVTATKPIGTAGWAWLDGTTAMYRPAKFWPGRENVTLTADLNGVTIGTTKVNGVSHPVIGKGVTTRTWKIGRSQVITVNGKTDKAVVVTDGKKIRTMGVSLGMPGWVTRSGIKVFDEAYKVHEMTSAAVGASQYYDLMVPYAIRMTDSGEFMHGAPWADYRIGKWNGSHGCTNLHVSDAKWLYSHYLRYDPVVTTGTNRKMETNNGIGAPWNYTWKTWSSGHL